MSKLMLLLPVFIPLLLAILVYLLPKNSTVKRRKYTMISVLLSSLSAMILVIFPPRGSLILLDIGKSLSVDLSLALRMDGASKIFTLIIALFWPLATLYAFGYMKEDQRQASFFCFYTISFGAAMGVALSGNLLTLYVFYELLTMSTFPLVMHGHTKEHRRATVKYVAYSTGGAAFGFVGLMYLLSSAGTTEFSYGGFMGTLPFTSIAGWMFLFCFFGFGAKAAIFPLSKWLPTVSVAPTPVTALLHAVAVVNAGVFSILRIVYYCFGSSYLKNSNFTGFALAVSLFSLVYASYRALRSGHFKRRLAWSTVSNLSYILATLLLCSKAGLVAAVFHMIAHSLTKICSFFCAGSFMHETGKERLSAVDGIGKQMPITFFSFTLSACSLVGVPLFVGFNSKWLMLQAAVERGGVLSYFFLFALLLSAFLTAMYMFSVTIRAFFPKKTGKLPLKAKEAPFEMLFPTVVFAVSTVIFGVAASPLYSLIVTLLP